MKDTTMQTQHLRSSAMLFCCNQTGQCLVFKRESSSLMEEGDILFSPDGAGFFELFLIDRQHHRIQDLSNGYASDKEFLVCDPHRNEISTIRHHREVYLPTNTVIKDTVDFQGNVFVAAALPDEISFVPLPAEITMPPAPWAELFRSDAGRSIMIPAISGQLWLSEDGTRFAPVRTHNFSGNRDEHSLWIKQSDHSINGQLHRKGNELVLNGSVIGHELSLDIHDNKKNSVIKLHGKEFVVDDNLIARHKLLQDDLRLNKDGALRLIGNELVHGGEVFTRTSHPDKITLVRSRVVRTPGWLFHHPDGRKIGLTYDKNRDFDHTLKLFIGTGDVLHCQPVRNVQVFGFGTEFLVSTDAGTLHVRAARQNLPPTWIDMADKERLNAEYAIMKDGNLKAEQERIQAEWNKRTIPLQQLDLDKLSLCETEQELRFV